MSDVYFILVNILKTYNSFPEHKVLICHELEIRVTFIDCNIEMYCSAIM